MRRRLLRPRVTGNAGLETSALAPLVDMITLVLLFLLKAWSADPPVQVDDPLFSLVRTASEAPVQPRLPIDISARSIFFDGVRITGTAFYATEAEAMIPELHTLALARSGAPVALRVDSTVPYRVVRKVLFTLREAGVSDVSLVARSRSGL